MAVIYCPNCRSAVSSRERRCWICDKALAPPVPAPTKAGPATYPQRMRLVRMEETSGGLADGFRCKIVYLKSVEDPAPVRDYWQAAQNQRLLRARKAGAALAASLTVLLVILLGVLAVPASQPLPSPPVQTTIAGRQPTLAPPAAPVITPKPFETDSTASIPLAGHGDLGFTSPTPASWGGDD